MSIVLIRIDDRLVHGQIVQGWLKSLDVDTVLVVSDSAASDKTQQILMGMALPSFIKLDVKTLKDATASLLNGDYDKEKVMILVTQPSDVVYMLERGLRIKSLNIGGMHFISGKKQLLKNICVNSEEFESLKQIYSSGIEIEGRVLPDDEKRDIMHILKKEHQTVCEADK
jgi:PTS system mannose-specific IIB component